MHVVRPALGGMRVHIEAVVRHLSGGPWRQVVVGSVGRKWQRCLEELGGQVYPLPISDRLEVYTDLCAVWGLSCLVRRIRPAVLHCHGAKAALLGRLVVPRAAPVVYTVHGELLREGNGWVLPGLKYLTERLFVRLTHRYIAVSSAVAQELELRVGVPSNRIRVLHNGVEAKRFQLSPAERQQARAELTRQLDLPPGANVIGCVARLAPEKGLDVMIRALALIATRVVPGENRGQPVLVIVGEGPERGRLEQLAAELGLSGRVHLPGHSTNIPLFLGGLDVFVLPSRSEGQSIALLEAMAAGLPVVASGIGGVLDVVDDGENGVLVSPDRPAVLARAVERVLGPAGERLGRNASQHVSTEFDWPSTVRQLELLYEELSPTPSYS